MVRGEWHAPDQPELGEQQSRSRGGATGGGRAGAGEGDHAGGGVRRRRRTLAARLSACGTGVLACRRPAESRPGAGGVRLGLPARRVSNGQTAGWENALSRLRLSAAGSGTASRTESQGDQV